MVDEWCYVRFGGGVDCRQKKPYVCNLTVQRELNQHKFRRSHSRTWGLWHASRVLRMHVFLFTLGANGILEKTHCIFASRSICRWNTWVLWIVQRFIPRSPIYFTSGTSGDDVIYMAFNSDGSEPLHKRFWISLICRIIEANDSLLQGYNYALKNRMHLLGQKRILADHSYPLDTKCEHASTHEALRCIYVKQYFLCPAMSYIVFVCNELYKSSLNYKTIWQIQFEQQRKWSV